MLSLVEHIRFIADSYKTSTLMPTDRVDSNKNENGYSMSFKIIFFFIGTNSATWIIVN